MRHPQLNKHGELQHLLTLDGLPRDILTAILDTAAPFTEVAEREVKKLPLLRGKSVFNLFFENSTRTRTTFEIAANGLQRMQSPGRREDVDAAMEEGMMEIVPRLEKRTHYLATFANVITLVGLLGTIIGLIKAFTAVSNVNPAEKAELLAASISIAMNNTAFALMVAIPFLLIHAFLQARATEIVDSLEAAKISFLNLTQRLAPPVQRGAE